MRGEWVRQLLWFAGLWLGGVLTLAILTILLRWAMSVSPT